MVNIINRDDLGPVVGPRELRELPVHRWFVYPHSYGASLVNEILDTIKAKSGDFVWDPFVGAGTTMVVCREREINGFGTDILPLSITVSRAKVASYRTNQLEKHIGMLSKIKFSDTLLLEDTDIPFVKKVFSTQARSCAYQIRSAILDEIPVRLRPFFLTALVHSYYLFGSYKRDGGWPRLDSLVKREARELLPTFVETALKMTNDIRQESSYFETRETSYKIRMSDYRSVQCSNRYDAVVTSPPYLNKHDYTRLFAPELSLLGLAKNADLIKLRYRTLRSHVEAKPHSNTTRYQVDTALCDIIPLIKERDYDYKRSVQLITGYFEDLYEFLKVCSDNLKKAGHLCLVISNVQFSGIAIKVDEILSDLASLVNLELKEKWLLRQRGNSSQQMAKYGRHPASEWVLIWKRK